MAEQTSELKVGDTVSATINRPGEQSANTTRFEGPIVAMTPEKVQVASGGLLVWLDKTQVIPNG